MFYDLIQFIGSWFFPLILEGNFAFIFNLDSVFAMCKALGLSTGYIRMNKTLLLPLSSLSHGGEWWLTRQLQYKAIMLL